MPSEAESWELRQEDLRKVGRFQAGPGIAGQAILLVAHRRRANPMLRERASRDGKQTKQDPVPMLQISNPNNGRQVQR